MLENATRICEAKFGTLSRYNGETFATWRAVRPFANIAESGMGGRSNPAWSRRSPHEATCTSPIFTRTQPKPTGEPCSIAELAGARTLAHRADAQGE